LFELSSGAVSKSKGVEMKRSGVKVSLISCGLALLLVSTSGTAASAVSDDISGVPTSNDYSPDVLPPNDYTPDVPAPDPDNIGKELRIGPSLEDSVSLGVVGDPPMTANLFDPIDTYQCEVIGNADHMIVEVYTYEIGTPSGGYLWPGGDTDLRCGTTSTSGWKHIQERHQWPNSFHPYAWESIRYEASRILGHPSEASWDDYMWDAVQWTFAEPAERSYLGNDKVCLSVDYALWLDYQPVTWFYVNTIASRNNLLVISAYPSDSRYYTDCSD
jgi:hypothetical protein